ncbi:MAG TPA: heavy metal-responsive transcriptional regulator [Vicinamibacterales bacterium]|nr:heavy metal-responsive transcriptional regulator [Vicinamibacterales bacterium]
MGLRIGQLARDSGVSADTIRYYERLGLLPRPSRTPNGYREFPDGAVTRVHVIRNAVRFGFPLKEVARFLKVRDAGGAPCDQVRAVGQKLLIQMDEKIAELVTTRAAMAATLQDWDTRLARAGGGHRAHLLEAVPPELKASKVILPK